MITTTLISSCHWNTLVPFCLWKKSKLSQNRTEKQIMPLKTTVNWLLTDIWQYLVIYQSVFTCSKLTIETLWTYFPPCSGVSTVNFEHVIAGWDGCKFRNGTGRPYMFSRKRSFLFDESFLKKSKLKQWDIQKMSLVIK